MSEPLLRGEERNTLRRHNGKLAIKSANCCAKCSDNPTTEPPCDIFTRAAACYSVLGSDCNREIVPYIYMCAKSYVGETKPSNPDYRTPAGITFHHPNGYCYTTTGELFEEEDLPSPHPDVSTMAVALQLDALPEGCQTAICGTAGTQCGCLCFAYGSYSHHWPTTPLDCNGNPGPSCGTYYTNPIETFCCAGKVDSNGNLCFDANFNSYWEENISYTCRRPNCVLLTNGAGNPILGQACVEGRNCKWFRSEQQSRNPEGYEICGAGCCRDKEYWERLVTNRGEYCGPETLTPEQMDWHWTGAIQTYCTPAALGSDGCSYWAWGNPNCPGYQVLDGCPEQSLITVSTNYTCGQTTIYFKQETWAQDRSVCDDGNGGSFQCCTCAVYQKTETGSTMTYTMTGSSDIECNLCRAELHAIYAAIPRASQAKGTKADDMSGFLFV